STVPTPDATEEPPVLAPVRREHALRRHGADSTRDRPRAERAAPDGQRRTAAHQRTHALEVAPGLVEGLEERAVAADEHRLGQRRREVRPPELVDGLRLAKPAGGAEPRRERRAGNRMEQADHRVGYAGALDELALALEDLRAVAVEADDESAPDVEPVREDTVDARDHVAAEVLSLPRFLERRGLRALDPEKDAPEAGVPHRRHERPVVGEVQRRFGVEVERPAASLLPGAKTRQERPHRLLVADEVVDEEDAAAEAGRMDRVELRLDLRRGLRPRPPPVDDDDVAELAGERTAARV